ncbi:MAG: homocysteine S-methyltransferase family protein [Treponema sp.]|uniref:homocysteine S-methyltransferase family protein n=1 Tax=Treponema sp. TaxID=166 RepID=UPI002A91A074|nr:homocysteine S-methyltransferase family protein [Treponema sp.]MDY6396149.1 homocysteine S-methyltransferase family protein [Treponema sp.]
MNKSKKPTFREFLKSQVEAGLPVFFDGGIGTMIQKTGFTDYDIPEDISIEKPEIIEDIHKAYLRAGANVITANTFGALPLKLISAKYSCKEYIEAEIALEKKCIEEIEAEGNTRPHYASWDTSQIGRLLEPMGELTFDEAYETYKEAAMIAEKAGAEIAIIETMADLREVKAAVLATKENTNLPIFASMTFQPNLRTLTGADIRTVVVYLESLGVDLIGFNCGGSLNEDDKIVAEFMRYAHLPVCVEPNAGLPTVINGKAVFLVGAEEFAEHHKKYRGLGASVFGGCCGTTPEHIAEMVKVIEFMPPQKRKPCEFENATFICSYNSSVQIGGNAGPQIIGERINPTGKKKVKEALLAHNMNFVLGEAESQINAGAQILDVNVGLPGIDEAQTMVDAVKTIQGAFNTPLQIDSSEGPVLEKALRYYNGKALINSTNGRQDVMDKVLPLVKKYGGAVVALCIDEAGIAPTAEGRVAVAEKIIAEAAKYGIPVRDIVIDTLTLTVSSQQKEALETVRAIQILKEKYGEQGLQFVLGVSNISFGIPRRDIINSRFFAMALYAGLSACIINPLMQPMMETYYGYRALAGFDENCLDYIEKYNDTPAPVYGLTAEQVALAKGASTSLSHQNALGIGGAATAVAGGNGATAEPQKARPPEAGTPSVDGVIGTPKLPENLTESESSLINIICKGFKDSSPEATKKLLEEGKEPVEIIDRCIVPALDIVGKDFEIGKKFLPQLLLSADTVSNSFAVIKAHLEASGVAQESKGSIVICTVFGDIHDIGKNIVKAMLENYGYTVIDLGKNVPAEKVVETVLEKDIQLVGLSALMTTTVANMEDTIKLLREKLGAVGKTCKIMVGGAVLTADYASQIGADYYAKDAMVSVSIAKEVFGK